MTSETNQGTKIFGIQIPVSQKTLGGCLLGLLILVAAYNFGPASDNSAVHTASPSIAKAASSLPTSSLSTRVVRKSNSPNKSKEDSLRLKPVDPASVTDPTLKLALLERVRSVKLVENIRNLFEAGPEGAVAPNTLPPVPPTAKMLPKPAYYQGPNPPGPKAPPPPLNIPLRYYGFIKPGLRTDGNRGYFMEGDNILMATEGDVLESRYLVVSLSPQSARIEDIQVKQGQDLPLIPEAVVPTQ